MNHTGAMRVSANKKRVMFGSGISDALLAVVLALNAPPLSRKPFYDSTLHHEMGTS